MIPALRHLSVRFRLTAALAVLFCLMLLVSLIGLRVLNRTEFWMNTLHQDTLAEVSDALNLSRLSADLATSAPFLYALFPPFQLEQESQDVLETLRKIESQAQGEPALDLPLARLRLAIDDLTTALVPQTARKADLVAIDRGLERLNQRARRQAGDTSRPLAEREIWTGLQQLTASAIGAVRANALIELGEFSRRYAQARAALQPKLLPPLRATFDEIDRVLSRSEGLFVLKHKEIAAQLDAENALYRIRQEASRITRFAEDKVAQAEARLSQARAETSNNLSIAKNWFLALTLMSLLVAISSSQYVSRYVAGNLQRIAEAMRRLAAGNHRADLPKGPKSTDEIGQLFAAFAVFRENARKLDRRTSQIRHQNALFSRVFRNITDGVAITSAQGEIEAENDNLRQLLRLPPAPKGHQVPIPMLMAQSTFSPRASADEPGGFEEFTDPSGNVLELRHSPLPDGGAVWLLSETTERKKVEERLEEIRRVETLGKVSGEIAHDFGNILSSISGNLHLLESAEPAQSQHFRARIRSAVDLGVSLTERLLAFARKQHLEPQVTDIGQLIDGMVDLLEIALPGEVTLQYQAPEQPVLARVDPGQLESAVLNLCVNAGQSIEGAGTVTLTVRDDHGARLTIQDSGAGMSPEVLRRATEPFFTNRADGSGTGLGLSMVDGFVHQSGGQLLLNSRVVPPNQGTAVTLQFPALRTEHDGAALVSSPGSALVVDDDPASLASASKALEQLGYAVTQATSFHQGLDQLENLSRPDLILSDLNLDSGASGWELLIHGHDLHPACQLALMSTRENPIVPSELSAISNLSILTKPLGEDEVKQLLLTANQNGKP
ncbi:ATP-binding protein [Pseudophaeobacter sp.]|uniref:ATP-binding protein n=1 Tax=Pseudophaeobacter sp. TaxID=1971739 RepID=UPI0032981726